MSAESSRRPKGTDSQSAVGRDVSAGQKKGQKLRRSKSRTLRGFACRPDVKSTADLVRVYNDTEDDEARQALEHWLQVYIDWFEDNIKMTIGKELVSEYIILFDVRKEHLESKNLKQAAFAALCKRLHEKHFEENEVNEALTAVLQSIEPDVFEGDPTALIRLVVGLLEQLDPNRNVFSKSTYGTHLPKLLAVRQLLLIIQEVAPDDLHPTGSRNVYSDLKTRLDEIKECQTHFPIFFELQLIEQILCRLAFDTEADLAKEIRRLLLAASGCAYAVQGVRSILFAGFDIGSFEKAYQKLKEAWKREGIEKKSWFDHLLDLEAERMFLKETLDGHVAFMECFSQVMACEESLNAREDRLLLRYGIVQELLSVALHGTKQGKKEACAELMYLATRYIKIEGWADDKEIFQALYGAMCEVHEKGEHKDLSEPALAVMNVVSEARQLVTTAALCFRCEMGFAEGSFAMPPITISQSPRSEARDK